MNPRHAAASANHCLLAMAMLVGSAAAGAQTSPWYLGAAQTFAHESNLYRVGDGQALPAGLARSDTVSTTSLLGGIDQPIGRQRIHGTASVSTHRYQHNDNLDNDGYALNLGLDWSTIERLSGSVNLGLDRSLARFNTFNGAGRVETRKNLLDNEQFDATVRLGLVTRLSAEATLGHRAASYSADEYRYREYRQDSASLGLRYRPGGVIDFGAALRDTEGRYPRFRQVAPGQYQPDRFTRQDLDLTSNWQPSGASRVAARLSSGRTRYEQDTQRDFSGLTGAATWFWQPGGKLRLRTDLSREIGQNSDFVDAGFFGTGFIDYSRTTNALRVRADHDLSAKVGLNASLTQARRTLVDTLALSNNAPVVRSGSDDTTTLALGGRWTPTRNTQLGCDLSHERRRTDSPLSTNMSASSVSCFGQIVLQ